MSVLCLSQDQFIMYFYEDQNILFEKLQKVIAHSIPYIKQNVQAESSE